MLPTVALSKFFFVYKMPKKTHKKLVKTGGTTVGANGVSKLPITNSLAKPTHGQKVLFSKPVVVRAKGVW